MLADKAFAIIDKGVGAVWQYLNLGQIQSGEKAGGGVSEWDCDFFWEGRS